MAIDEGWRDGDGGEEEEKRCRWEMDVEREARKKTDKTTARLGISN